VYDVQVFSRGASGLDNGLAPWMIGQLHMAHHGTEVVPIKGVEGEYPGYEINDPYERESAHISLSKRLEMILEYENSVFFGYRG
jgi:hypothetical protein